MKKIINLLMMAVAVFAYNACDDVPAPYELNTGTEKPEGVYLSESFSSGFGEFKVVNLTSDSWKIDFSCATATGYDNSTKETTPKEGYLVSPAVDLSASAEAYLAFDYVLRFKSNGINKVLVTAAYTGDPTTTEWEDITGALPETASYSEFAAYAHQLDAKYIGQKEVVVALYFKCTDRSGTWEVKNLKLLEGKAEAGEPDTPDTPDLPAGTYFSEEFSTTFGAFTLKHITGTPWMIDFKTAKASGYDNASKTTTPSESYIVSPECNLTASTGAVLAFDYVLRFASSGTNQVLVTDNYTGDPATTTWEDITGTLTEGRDYTTFYHYEAALPEKYLGKSGVRVAFYYKCGESSGTWEVKNASLKDGKPGEGGGGNPGDNPGGTTTELAGDIVAQAASFGLENAADAGTITLEDGTTLAFDAGGNSLSPKFYTAGGGTFRMYPQNSFTVTASKPIAKIVVSYDVYNGTMYYAEKTVTATPGTVAYDEANQLIEFSGINSATTVIKNDCTGTGGTKQLRIKALAITYVK